MRFTASDDLPTRAPKTMVARLEPSQGFSEGQQIFLLTCGVGLLFLSTVSLALCWFWRKPKKLSQNPPSPMCKRQVSVHIVYPTTPHAIRLPLYCQQAMAENSSPMITFHLPKNYTQYLMTQQETKTNTGPLVLQVSRLPSSSPSSSSSPVSLVTTPFSRIDSTDSSILGMPNLEERHLPGVHRLDFPTPDSKPELDQLRL